MTIALQPVRHSIPELISFMDEPNRSICARILKENYALFSVTPGSVANHQTWPGGYLDHIEEVMNYAVVFYDLLMDIRPLPFMLSDALLVLFLHDIKKPWEKMCHLNTKQDGRNFRCQKIEEYKISLTPEQVNALKYVEGEGNDYTRKERTMGPLAAFCHLPDTTSSRLHFNYPKDNDEWFGARRFSK